MPTIFRAGPYRVFFYAGDHGEPVHVHVERDDKIAKFWLEPVRLVNMFKKMGRYRAAMRNDIFACTDKWLW